MGDFAAERHQSPRSGARPGGDGYERFADEVEDWFEDHLPNDDLFVPDAFDVVSDRERVRKTIALVLLFQWVTVTVLTVIWILFLNTGSVATPVLLSILGTSSAAAMVAVRWYFK